MRIKKDIDSTHPIGKVSFIHCFLSLVKYISISWRVAKPSPSVPTWDSKIFALADIVLEVKQHGLCVAAIDEFPVAKSSCMLIV
jgi:hypothetical protein